MPISHLGSGPLVKRLVIAVGAFLVVAALLLFAAKVLFEKLDVTTAYPEHRSWDEKAGKSAAAVSAEERAADRKGAIERPIGQAPTAISDIPTRDLLALPPAVARGPAATRERPELGSLDRRANEDDTSFSLRKRLIASYQQFVTAAKLTPVQDEIFRRILFDAQLNYALWKRSFVKPAMMDDFAAGKTAQSGESYVETTVEALGRFIPAAAASVLSRQQLKTLASPTFKFLAGGSGVTAQPFDVDEASALGINEDTDRGRLREVVRQRLELQLPDSTKGAGEARQFIVKRLRAD